MLSENGIYFSPFPLTLLNSVLIVDWVFLFLGKSPNIVNIWYPVSKLRLQQYYPEEY